MLDHFTAPGPTRLDRQLIRASRKFARWLVESHDLNDRLRSRELRSLRRRQTSLRSMARCARLPRRPHDDIALLHDQNAHAGLLVLGKRQETPIHDHANSTSLSLLLAGDATIEWYRLCNLSTGGYPELIKYKTARLHDSAKNTLCITPKGDLHRLRSQNQASIILNIQLPPVQADKRVIAIITGKIGPEQYQCVLITEKAMQQISRNQQPKKIPEPP